ncbi:hypothetical protein ABOM_003926 [Aspergillus bombycis]|uniref:Uncharacterized protein n=1 Tax=Aspergillus bombycis TaxID=109264 RepID=A0A1F8A6E4_9EURO|nr:hypothetical protein ABOM_003926 [Aspergillus bombycis]OGM47253.1 hypothetical protein ABOM_003926 [Aspergillus bombycis]
MSRPRRPSQREEFEIAIICALPLEYDAVSLLFDRFWDESGDQYGRAAGDTNYYTTGQIGNYNVVLALLPNMGKASAAAAAANLRSSYPGLKLAFLAGICGGTPKHPETGDEILLGDVVISKTVIQYDFGRQNPGQLVRKDTLDDNLGRPDRDVRSLLAILQTELGRERLQERTAQYLRRLQDLARRKKRRSKYVYPGTAEDKLFDPRYRHKHHGSSLYGDCKDCSTALDSICTEAYHAICTDIPCNERFLVHREKLDAKQHLEHEGKKEAQDPAIHIGRIASGDMVMKSGEHREMFTHNDQVIAFEMESAGIWDEIRSVVVKGVCDYADSHKNKKWQDFAALTSASTIKALLERYTRTDKAVKSVFIEAPPSQHEEEEEIKQIVLEMLNFPRIHSRHEEIAGAHSQTFSWILSHDASFANNDHNLEVRHRQVRAGFASWLREGSGIYWVSGKAGSGKSTLMKLIRTDPQTSTHLQHWAGETPVIIGHFYFYDRGSVLEKSRAGLLRALLLQLLGWNPSWIPQAFAGSWSRLQRLRTTKSFSRPTDEEFSLTELHVAFRSVLALTVSAVRVCLFIDGLDEYEGSDREISRFVTELADSKFGDSRWHKLCLSSRSHPAFEEAFKNCPHLKLQELTYNDIYRYVYAHLGSHSRYEQILRTEHVARFQTLVSSVVEQACGVFLWVQLAVWSLLDGLDQYDWIDELERRVQALPPELEQFYDRMLRMIDPGYRRQAVRIFRLMLDSGNPQCVMLSFIENDDLGVLTYPAEGFLPDNMHLRSNQMAARLKSKLGGLVEVSRTDGKYNWMSSVVTFFHQTLREYLRQPAPWEILLGKFSVRYCDNILFHHIFGYCLGVARRSVANEELELEDSKQELIRIAQARPVPFIWLVGRPGDGRSITIQSFYLRNKTG